MNRRAFLNRLTRASGGLIVLPASLELLETIIPPRRYWPGADFTRLSDYDGKTAYVQEYVQRFMRVQWDLMMAHADVGAHFIQPDPWARG